MRKTLPLLAGLCLIMACHKKNNPTPTIPAPDKASLTFPSQNAACTTGTIISAVQSTVTLTWNTAANSDSYELGIKNLLTQTITYKNTTATHLTDTLDRNTPYSWFIVTKSKASSDTTKSDVWKFYNAGPGTLTYAPFPADLVTPGFNHNVPAGTVNLAWNGSSVDNDIAGYDVYFGTNTTPPLFKSNVTDMFLNAVTVTSATTYYWKVVTKDLIGNTSVSTIAQFKVN
ncbi:hypothetical protein ACFFGT_04235 [Mucilaginibacter angelicae]|uniref:Fibronectin type-III domain-containing protein n=1 Tax=Mucilaginibacter angelicae TaxID=869718 RepID=A0ABV6L0X7_9SPHI